MPQWWRKLLAGAAKSTALAWFYSLPGWTPIMAAVTSIITTVGWRAYEAPWPIQFVTVLACIALSLVIGNVFREPAISFGSASSAIATVSLPPRFQVELDRGPGSEVSFTLTNTGGSATVTAWSQIREGGAWLEARAHPRYRLRPPEVIGTRESRTFVVARNSCRHRPDEQEAYDIAGFAVLYLPGEDTDTPEERARPFDQLRLIGWNPDPGWQGNHPDWVAITLAIDVESDPPSDRAVSLRVILRDADHGDLKLEQITA